MCVHLAVYFFLDWVAKVVVERIRGIQPLKDSTVAVLMPTAYIRNRFPFFDSGIFDDS